MKSNVNNYLLFSFVADDSMIGVYNQDLVTQIKE